MKRLLLLMLLTLVAFACSREYEVPLYQQYASRQDLTVAQVTDSDFTVSLIPHTREVTNLGSKKTGSPINIETDVLGKYVEKMLKGSNAPARAQGNMTLDFLRENGF